MQQVKERPAAAVGLTPDASKRIESRIHVRNLVAEEIAELGRKIDRHRREIDEYLWEIDRLKRWFGRQS